jgi:hypothetical protein
MMKVTKRAAIASAAGALVVAGVGGASMTSASGAATVHTLKFNSIEIASHGLGKTSFASADVDKRKGKVIGYDSVTGKFNVHTHVANLSVALALKGGVINVSGSSAESGAFVGKVTGGSGKYKGIKGTVTGDQVNNKTTAVVIKYHF